MVCTFCGSEIPETAQVCPHCWALSPKRQEALKESYKGAGQFLLVFMVILVIIAVLSTLPR
jgi:predicted nucleic acid-binding Zn ribbon protein